MEIKDIVQKAHDNAVLDAVIAEKMAYNAGRPYKHGKRF